jgi:hypothetical protein
MNRWTFWLKVSSKYHNSEYRSWSVGCELLYLFCGLWCFWYVSLIESNGGLANQWWFGRKWLWGMKLLSKALASETEHSQQLIWRMPSSGMLRRVALVRTTWRNIPEDAILHSHRRENLKPYLNSWYVCFWHACHLSVMQVYDVWSLLWWFAG